MFVNLLNKIPHWLIVIVGTFWGGFMGYFQQNEGNVVAAMGSWQTIRPILIGSIIAGAGTLLALAKESWLPNSAKVTILALGVSLLVQACSQLSAVVANLANIAQQIIVDEEAGMQGPAIVEDILTRFAGITLEEILAAIDGLLSDPKLPSTDVAGLQSAKSDVTARMAAKAKDHAINLVNTGIAVEVMVSR